MDAISLASESDSDRIPIILFLTDGGPSVDGKDIQSVVQTISESASSSISINGISLGTNDLTGWQLVQRLTQKNRGLSSKVLNIKLIQISSIHEFWHQKFIFSLLRGLGYNSDKVSGVQPAYDAHSRNENKIKFFSFLISPALVLRFRKSFWK